MGGFRNNHALPFRNEKGLAGSETATDRCHEPVRFLFGDGFAFLSGTR